MSLKGVATVKTLWARKSYLYYWFRPDDLWWRFRHRDDVLDIVWASIGLFEGRDKHLVFTFTPLGNSCDTQTKFSNNKFALRSCSATRCLYCAQEAWKVSPWHFVISMTTSRHGGVLSAFLGHVPQVMASFKMLLFLARTSYWINNRLVVDLKFCESRVRSP